MVEALPARLAPVRLLLLPRSLPAAERGMLPLTAPTSPPGGTTPPAPGPVLWRGVVLGSALEAPPPALIVGLHITL